MDKSKLDKAIIDCWAQPLGSAYDNIIVHWSKEGEFLEKVFEAGFSIKSLDLWKYFRWEKPTIYPEATYIKSLYYSGYFLDKPFININDLEKTDGPSQILEKIEKAREDYFEKTKPYKEYEKLPDQDPESDIVVFSYVDDPASLNNKPYTEVWAGFSINTPEEWKNDQENIKIYSDYIGGIFHIFYKWNPINMLQFTLVPETEMDTEIYLIIEALKNNEKGAVYRILDKYFGPHAFRIPKKECLKKEAEIKKLIDTYLVTFDSV